MKSIYVMTLLSALAGSICAAADSAEVYQARCVPHRASGKTDGFQCSNIGPGSNFTKAGLKEGDIVLSIDHVKIDNPQTAMAMFEKIEKASCKEIVVSRAGKVITLKPAL